MHAHSGIGGNPQSFCIFIPNSSPIDFRARDKKVCSLVNYYLLSILLGSKSSQLPQLWVNFHKTTDSEVDISSVPLCVFAHSYILALIHGNRWTLVSKSSLWPLPSCPHCYDDWHFESLKIICTVKLLTCLSRDIHVSLLLECQCSRSGWSA